MCSSRGRFASFACRGRAKRLVAEFTGSVSRSASAHSTAFSVTCDSGGRAGAFEAGTFGGYVRGGAFERRIDRGRGKGGLTAGCMHSVLAKQRPNVERICTTFDIAGCIAACDVVALIWWQSARMLRYAVLRRFDKKPSRQVPEGAFMLAEGQGFEPWSPGLPVKRFSRPPHSTTLPPLRRDGAEPVRGSAMRAAKRRRSGKGTGEECSRAVAPVVKSGGEIGIRTLGTLLAHTRFPIVHLRPARSSLRSLGHDRAQRDHAAAT